ncbi:SEL1-like repeat protein [Chryseobacterium sp. 1B4]
MGAGNSGKNKLYEKAVEDQNLKWLEGEVFAGRGYDSFLTLLETDWIEYGLGYWNEELYKNPSETFEENGFWGLKDKKGQVIVPAVYEEIFAFSNEGTAVAQKNGKFGYLGNDGRLMVDCLYEEAFDTLSIEEKEYGIVQMDGKSGLIDIKANTLVIPCEYDDLELLMYKGLFNAQKEGRYRVIDILNRQIAADHSETAFGYEYPDLIYRRQQGTSKRAYYTLEGICLGEYPEDTVEQIANGYYRIKPNKFQKKISLIKPDGSLLDEDADQIMVFREYGYTAFAYRKDKKWHLYDTEHELFRLVNEAIVNIQMGGFYHLMKDVFILSDQTGTGLYDAANDRWFLPLSENHLKIEICSYEIFRIATPEGMYYYDQKTDFKSPVYDYICEGIGYDAELLCLFKGNEMCLLDEDRTIRQISDFNMGALYEKRYNLRGKDQKYFTDFYKRWTEKTGSGYEIYFDNDTLKSQAAEHQNNGNIREAIRLFTIGAERGNADMMTELGFIYTDDSIPEFYDLQKGLDFYEKAAEKDQRYAWNNLGYHYQNGIGLPQDIIKAAECYEKAAALGHGLAFENLGHLYFYGEHVEKNHDLALEYYKKAEKKFQFNDENISEIYYQKEDYDNLQRYIRKDYNSTYSNIYYGIMYDHGLGVKQNIKKAVSHYEKALEYSTYFYALERLLYYYKEDPAFADPEKYRQWKIYGEENDMGM